MIRDGKIVKSRDRTKGQKEVSGVQKKVNQTQKGKVTGAQVLLPPNGERL